MFDLLADRHAGAHSLSVRHAMVVGWRGDRMLALGPKAMEARRRRGSNQDRSLIVAGKYRLLSVLGQGGMGTVWRAEHLQLGATVAVKLIDPKAPAVPMPCGSVRRKRARPRRSAARTWCRCSISAATMRPAARSSSWSSSKGKAWPIADPAGQALAGRNLACADPRRARSQPRARRRHHSPRPETGERVPGPQRRGRRAGQGPRLRHRPRAARGHARVKPRT